MHDGVHGRCALLIVKAAARGMVRFLLAAWAEIAGKRSWHECLKRGHWKVLCGLTRQASAVSFKTSLASALNHERVNAEPARMLWGSGKGSSDISARRAEVTLGSPRR